MKYQILCDSSGDLPQSAFKNSKIGYSVVPLSILVGDKEFVDDENLDTHEMLSAMHAHISDKHKLEFKSESNRCK